MKFTLHRAIAGADLKHVVPRVLWSRTPDSVRHAPGLTAVVFHTSVGLVRALLARKALARVRADDPLPLLVAADEFSADAEALLRPHCTYLISRGDFYWTDQRYDRIRAAIDSGPKRPAIWAPAPPEPSDPESPP